MKIIRNQKLGGPCATHPTRRAISPVGCHDCTVDYNDRMGYEPPHEGCPSL